MADDKFTIVGMNIAEKATMFWNVADMLHGHFKPHALQELFTERCTRIQHSMED